MDTGSFVSYINSKKRMNIPTEFFSKIQTWRLWWEGYNKDFHRRTERGAAGNAIVRDMYQMRMAKRVCESWASLLLNEQTLLELEDARAQEWLCGKDNEDGVLADLDFWDGANKLVELAFRSGTGAFVMRIEGLQMQGANILQNKNARILIEYLPAECILPITVRHGVVQDVAFMSEIMLQGKKCIYLETHTLEQSGYVITNEFFEAKDGDGYAPLPCPAGVLPKIVTNSTVPWFGILRPNIVQNMDALPGMGIAVFANAIDQLKACDMAYNNFVRDFYLGGKKVFYSKALIQYDPKGQPIAPDDVCNQLFTQLGDGNGMDDDKKPLTEFNPTLRVDENKNGIQAALDYLSFACGLGTRHFRFDSGTGQVTATQYTGDRQDMRQNANKHQITIKAALLHIVRAILWAGKNLLGADIDPECKITVVFDDSYIIDAATEREIDRMDVQDGTLAKYEYRMRWRGESEEDAKKAIEEMKDPSDDDLMGFNTPPKQTPPKDGAGGDK